MIFISHTHADKALVDVIAQRIAAVVGRENVFYDSWSIQPGDGIIEKMSEGLASCRFFFFFVSKNSLQSGMVKIEWQNAIIKRTRGQVYFVPVKLDDCLMPDVLLQTLYIDIFGKGLEHGIRQMIDVIAGQNTYQPGVQEYQNVRAYLSWVGNELLIEFRAETYFEPMSRYLVLTDHAQDEIEVTLKSDSMFQSNFFNGITLDTGLCANAAFVGLDRGTAPNFPIVVSVKKRDGGRPTIKGLMRAIAHDNYASIPVIG